jgi:hypothetical protein
MFLILAFFYGTRIVHLDLHYFISFLYRYGIVHLDLYNIVYIVHTIIIGDAFLIIFKYY